MSPMDVTIRSVYDQSRGVRISATSEPELTESAMTWHVLVPSREQWQAAVEVQAVIGNEWVQAQPDEETNAVDDWLTHTTTIAVEHHGVSGVLDRSLLDLDALRICDPQGRSFLAAGAPWFMTLFGRDSLLTAWMCLPLDVDLAIGTMHTLAALQGHEVDPVTEEQPGRILHELRLGPDSKDALGGHEYYGTVDASPLFVMLLGEAFRWGADPSEIHDLLPAADAALHWLEQYGDCRPRRLRRIPAGHRSRPAQPGLEGQLRQHQLRQRRHGRGSDRTLRGAGLYLRGAAHARRPGRRVR